MKHCAWVLLLGVLVTGCMKLDGFLFDPTVAHDSDDLMAAATMVPANLVQELKGEIISADGVPVNAYLLSHDASDNTPIQRHQTGLLYCHGNITNISNYALRAQALWLQGYTVLIFDYRGYGKTPGTPSESGVYADGRAARAYLERRSDLGLSAERVALYGWSLGAAVCTELAVESHTPALLLEAPFASVAELITDSSSLDMPRPWCADAQFDNRGKIPGHEGALLVMHGSADTYIQPRYGEEVSAAAQGHAHPNTLWIAPGAGHDTVPCVVPDRPTNHEGCIGGFSDAYFNQVNTLLDAALP